MRTAKVLLADDHRMLRKAWKLILQPYPNLEIIGEVENGLEAIDFCENTNVNLVIMDIEMPKLNGFEATKIIHEKFPFTKVLIVSMYQDQSYIKKLFSAGASGYLTKNCTDEEFIQAIDIIRNGGKYIGSEIQENFFSEVLTEKNNLSPLAKITKREKEIIKYITNGYSSKMIAENLFLSLKTIECHRSNIYKKLNVKNVVELIQATKGKLFI